DLVRSQQIACEWRRRARELAERANEGLGKRPDGWGGDPAPRERGEPPPDGGGGCATVYTPHGGLTRAPRVRPFEGPDAHPGVGLHATSPDNPCRWGAFDVDVHDEATDPAWAFRQACHLHEEASRRGFHPLLTTSNGKGGYHVRIILAAPVPSPDLHFLLG